MPHSPEEIAIRPLFFGPLIRPRLFRVCVCVCGIFGVRKPLDSHDFFQGGLVGLLLGGHYLEQREMDRMTSTVRVFARAKPEDKLEIWVDGWI